MFSRWTSIISGGGRRNKADVRDIQLNLLLTMLESIPNITCLICPFKQWVDGHWELSLSTQSSSLWEVPSFWLWNPLQMPLLGNSSLQNWKATKEHSDITRTTPAHKALGGYESQHQFDLAACSQWWQDSGVGKGDFFPKYAVFCLSVPLSIHRIPKVN